MEGSVEAPQVVKASASADSDVATTAKTTDDAGSGALGSTDVLLCLVTNVCRDFLFWKIALAFDTR